MAQDKQPAFQRDDLIEGQIAHISYANQGRGGDVIVKWGDKSLTLWWEFSGGDALAYINIPSAEHWESLTGIPLAERDQTLHFIGKTVVRDQASGRRFSVENTEITIY